MKDRQTDISRLLRQVEADRAAGIVRVGLAVDLISSEARRLRGCLSDETIAAISAARIKSLLAPRNSWHLVRCSACRKEVVELRSLVRTAGRVNPSEPESDTSFDFFSLVVRYWQAFVSAGAAVLLLGSFLLFHVPRDLNPPFIAVSGTPNRALPAPHQAEEIAPTIIVSHDATNTPVFVPSPPTNGTLSRPNQMEDIASRGATNDGKHRVGIIVGCNDAPEASEAAEKLDAAYSAIRLLTSGSFPETRPTVANIVRELGQLPNLAEGGHLVVFWAGQGLCVGGHAYLLPEDATGDLKTTALTLEQLSKAVAGSRLNLQSRTLVVELGRNTSSSQSQEFLRCLLAHPGEWQVVTNARSWLQSVQNTNPEK